MSKKKKENEWVTYPEINPTIDELNAHFEMQDNEEKVIFTPKTEEEGRIDEFPALNPEDLQVPQLTTLPADPTEDKPEEISDEDLEKVKAELQNIKDELDAEDLNKKNYLKISPTLYIQTAENEVDDDGEVVKELFKVLNPETQTVETRELTDDEKKEFLILELKKSRQTFNPISNPTKTVGITVVEKASGRKVREKTREVATNETVNQFGADYKKKRKRKNKLTKKSRKANR